MNRRELLSAASAAVAGLGGTVKPIEAEPTPLALVVTFPIGYVDLMAEEIEDIKRKLCGLGIRDNQGRQIPVIVCPPGMDIKAMAIQSPGLANPAE